MSTDITAAELKERLANGEKPFILDVREDWEYQEQNIGGLNIPLGTLPDGCSAVVKILMKGRIVIAISPMRSVRPAQSSP